MMPSLGQIAIVALVVILIFGAGRIPKIMEDLGKGINSFKKGFNEEHEGGSNNNVEHETKHISNDKKTEK